MPATTPSGSKWTSDLLYASTRFDDRLSGRRTRSPCWINHSIFEQVVIISPRAASITKQYPLPSTSTSTPVQDNVRVFPVSRHATFAQDSWLSTSHLFRLRITRLLWVYDVCFHVFCALTAFWIFWWISASLSASAVIRCRAVAGSKLVIYRRLVS